MNIITSLSHDLTWESTSIQTTVNGRVYRFVLHRDLPHGKWTLESATEVVITTRNPERIIHSQSK